MAAAVSLRAFFLPSFLTVVLVCVGTSYGLSCFKCGQYNDGVGSITPCINYTAHMHLKECPPSAEWCIKYVSEGSTVRDCVPSCVEKDSWSTRTYCCKQDGCNSGPDLSASSGSLWSLALTLVLLGLGRRG
ncbi:uncharacterized protein LOC105700395 isoform X2 [Orussus abietinus]|uniref:uncharacterized protein LOC105700395 isoform X2 n=1 Tax=Orussus abietinus TaxID=222816 RepID=UPI000625DA4B|nr:uncharacterized protein LOC105700395 isoform X2 [Orussus abietinus]